MHETISLPCDKKKKRFFVKYDLLIVSTND